MSIAILLPGLLSKQPYHNIRWSCIPVEWNSIYQSFFNITLQADYYSGSTFRADIIRHTLYIYSRRKRFDLEDDAYLFSFSLSELACALRFDVIDFRTFLLLFIELENNLNKDKDQYFMCIVTGANRSTLNENIGHFYPTFTSHQLSIYYIRAHESDYCCKILDQLELPYTLSKIRYPFHSDLSPLIKHKLITSITPIKKKSLNYNLFNLKGVNLHESLLDVNEIFNCQILFSKSIQSFSIIYEVSQNPQMIPLLKEVFPELENVSQLGILPINF